MGSVKCFFFINFTVFHLLLISVELSNLFNKMIHLMIKLVSIDPDGFNKISSFSNHISKSFNSVELIQFIHPTYLINIILRISWKRFSNSILI